MKFTYLLPSNLKSKDLVATDYRKTRVVVLRNHHLLQIIHRGELIATLSIFDERTCLPYWIEFEILEFKFELFFKESVKFQWVD
jgi:hypothetical protein